MTYGQKPPHRSGKRKFENQMKRYPPSLRNTYMRVHDFIEKIGGRNVEWYHLRHSETRYRTKAKPGQRRGSIFAYVAIYDGWLRVGLPVNDRAFQQNNKALLLALDVENRPSYWYGKGEQRILLDVADRQIDRRLALTKRLLRRALASAKLKLSGRVG